MLVVVQSDALVDPYAMMVELHNTLVAHGAVLGASRLVDFACAARVLLGVHDFVVFENALILLDGAGISLGIEVAWISRASFVVRVIAGERQ